MRAASLTLLTTLTAAALDVTLVSGDHGAVSASTVGFTVSGTIGGAVMAGGGGSGGSGWTTRVGLQTVLENVRHQTPAITGGPVATDEDTAVDVSLAATDPDTGGALTFTLSTPAHGTLTDLGGGSYRYVPDADHHGSDSFDVTTTDPALGGPVTRTIAITIASIDDAPVATTGPSISGSGRVGGSLTAAPGTWTDLRDGGASAITLSWIWQRSRPGGGWDSTGATGPTFTPGADDAGRAVRIVVSAANSDGPAIGTQASDAIVIRDDRHDAGDHESRWVRFRENTYDGYGRCGSGAAGILLCGLMTLSLRGRRRR